MSLEFPSSVIIVGAGVFGLSTALEISQKCPSTKIILIDRQVPPVSDGTSVNTSRILRPGEYEKKTAKIKFIGLTGSMFRLR